MVIRGTVQYRTVLDHVILPFQDPPGPCLWVPRQQLPALATTDKPAETD
jgi:hypothetical protein